MKRESLLHVLRGVVPALLLALPLQACMEPTSVTCASGWVCPAGQQCAANQEVCIVDDCGDGILQSGETCDDGNIRPGDGCNRTCKSDETCGNGITDIKSTVDTTNAEACDDGNNTDGDGCSANCLSSEFCGNGIVDIAKGEKCDDRNNVSGDGCSADCLSTEYCGNGYPDVAKGEKCDDGNNESGDDCSGDCKSVEICGNGIIDFAKGEVCDDRNNESGDGCRADCKSNETCGNGILDVAKGELCDDRNNTDGDGCSANCKTAGIGCGNGQLEAGEECDDANDNTEDNCVQCKMNYCGDGFTDKQLPHVEACDGKGESADCDIDCTLALCGDGIVNATRGEACDDGNDKACGTCGDKCMKRQEPKPATGSIIALTGEDIEDGDELTLSDGEFWLTFEFDKNFITKWNTIPINIDDEDRPDQIARAIRRAIQEADSDFKISAPSVSWNVVKLVNDKPGASGNVDITESVSNDDFKVEGMSGGSGYDCAPDMGCKSDADCRSGKCREGRCR
jgi:cysteine-rich repeat protein